ncbi:MAG: hypothetical protein NC133_00910 [Prevotella sp.]|nr:hypothetical protein [Prevotella sp.]
MNNRHHQAISLRQLCFGYFLYSTSIKLLTLPSGLASATGNWAWVSALLGVIFELVLVAIASIILKFTDNQNKFFRAVCWVLLPVVVGEIAITALQVYQLSYTDFFTNLGITVFVITMVALGCFFLTRQPRAVFRAGEILWLLFAFGLILAIVPTLYNIQVDWHDLVRGNAGQIVPATTMHLCFFETAAFVLAFGSETRKTNRDLCRLNLTALLCGIGYVAFMVLFVLLFGTLSQHQTMGLIDMTTAAQFITNTGSLDWVIAIAMMAALVLRFGVQLVAVVTLIKRGLNRQ